MRLQGKVAIITGGASGIGLATAKKFLQEGASVAIVDLSSQVVQEAVALLAKEIAGTQDLHCSIQGYSANVTVRSEIDQVVSEVMRSLGSIDVLVNNAGITKDATLKKMTEQQFDDVIDVNLKGVFNCSQAVVDLMLKQGSGVILNASSIVGLAGNFGQTNYAATKFGVIGFTKTWMRELGGKGIRVNAVCPGFIATPMVQQMPEQVLEGMKKEVPMKRLGQPEEVANLYAFLASDEASYINGGVFSVDGGLTL